MKNEYKYLVFSNVINHTFICQDTFSHYYFSFELEICTQYTRATPPKTRFFVSQGSVRYGPMNLQIEVGGSIVFYGIKEEPIVENGS